MNKTERNRTATREGGQARVRSRRRISPVALGLVIVFFALLLAGVYLQKLMSLIVVIEAVASVVAFVLYARDKSAAQTDQWRVSEGMLLWTGMIGGWPGALLAQQMFRHKTRKVSFQVLFWLSVVLNVGALWCHANPEKTFAVLRQWLL